MLSHDAYRLALVELERQLEDWADAFRAHAEIEIHRGAESLSVAAQPHAPGACGFELVLRPDQQFDLVVAGETFEDQPILAMARLRDLAVAIARGDVVRRVISSAATGRVLFRETEIKAASGSWTGVQRFAEAEPEATVCRTICFLPYREKHGLIARSARPDAVAA